MVEINSVRRDSPGFVRPTNMRFSEVSSYPRSWNQDAFPYIAHAEISTTQWGNFQRLIEDQTQTCILGHDLVDDDTVVAHVGCRSEKTRDLIESRWA